MRKIITVFAGTLVFLMWGEKSNACTPTPNFTSSATSINQGQSVNFTSTGFAGTPAATSWTWTFPGGTLGTSTAQHPAGIVYNTPGIYDVTHTATNTYTPPTGTITKTAYITVWSTTAPGSAGASINLTGTAPVATAILDINVTDKGVLIPRLTTAQRNNIPTPAQGLILYDSSNDSINFYNGTNWQRLNGKQVSTTTGSGTSSGTGIAINTTGNPADPSAILDVSSTTKGVLLPQTMKTNILSPSQGLIIYDTYYKKISYYDGAAWQTVCSALSTTTTGGGSLPVQGISINPSGTPPDASALLDLNVSDKGFLLPRLTDTQRDNIIAPAEGLIIYNASTNRINYYNGSAWYSSIIDIDAPPSQPGAISGSGAVCSASSQTYSISDVTEAISYTWTVPSGWIINSGQGTTSINVTASVTSGNISVIASNGCKNSAARTLAISVACCSCPCTFNNNAIDNGTIITVCGAIQTFIVPPGVTLVTIECWGGQGSNNGALGGYAKADVPVTPGEVLYIRVGVGGNLLGRCNGGGSGGSYGGDASDVRRSGQTLNDRIIVAGGGGGKGTNINGSCNSSGSGGGGGGGWYGGYGGGSGGNGGGTQTTGFSFGVGGSGSGGFGCYAEGCGGGSGGAGGCGGNANGNNGSAGSGGPSCMFEPGSLSHGSGGGGGSGYVDAAGNTNKSMSSCVQSGHGKVVISNCQ